MHGVSLLAASLARLIPWGDREGGERWQSSVRGGGANRAVWPGIAE